MAYIEDPDLAVMASFSDEELEPIFRCLVYDTDGKKRRTESVSDNPEYRRHKPHHHLYWQVLAGELQLFGGNSIMNFLRKGQGVLYIEILKDVASNFIKPYLKEHPEASASQIELELIKEVLKKYRNEIDRDADELKARLDEYDDNDIRDLIAELERGYGGFTSAGMLAFLVAGRVLPRAAASLLSGIVTVNALKYFGIRAALGFTGGRAGSVIFGPVGWGVTAAWALVDAAGPANRVVVPCVFHIAFLRLMHGGGK
ncbi:MAG: DUF3944 domain-containing protein [Succinivibrionaceae bacterium]|nr:DUF3944 domain-containing protein [Succinivibrionaceae bacterium]